MLISIFSVILFSFFLLHFVPGDPVEIMLGEQASPADKVELRAALGLDQPILTQLKRYLGGLATFDFGRTLTTRTPVFDEITLHFPATVELSIAALALALLWGLPLGVMAAVKANKSWDHFANFVALFAMSVPGVFLGPLLIYLFAVQMNWFPVSDRGGMLHLILPSISLAFPLGAVILRMSRTALLDVLREDYIRTATAKGVPDRLIYFKHALRNALIPIVTVVGLQAAALLTGTVITETIFDWPGLGSLLYLAIQKRDYPLVQGCILVIACIYVFINFFTDVVYGVVNPRVRLSESGS